MKNLSTFAIYTLGCKVNLYESNLIRNDLLSNGLVEVSFNEKADLYIINTCSVTSTADAKSRNIINRPKRINKNSIVVVMGCFSQTNKEQCSKLDVDIIIGNKYKSNITELINEFLKDNNKIIKIDNLLLENQFEESNVSSFKENTRAFIKIQDGCNFMCSYCIIPFSRGRQRSKKINNVITEVKNLINNGYKEIVLTGVNTAGYLDEDGNNFFNLLNEISKIEGDFRIRVSSVEPFQITDDIVDLITGKKDRFCQHWHICLQSGSDNVLNSMNRKYYTKQFLELINKIRSKSPNSTFTTDYIVGFPTETDEDHRKSIDFINKIKFLDMHIFPYSPRKGTAASRLKNIDDKVKQKRLDEIQNISAKNSEIILNNFIGKELEVIFETFDEKTSIWSGHSSEFINVLSKNNQDIKNKKMKVKIKRKIGKCLYGDIIS